MVSNHEILPELGPEKAFKFNHKDVPPDILCSNINQRSCYIKVNRKEDIIIQIGYSSWAATKSIADV